MSSRGLEPLGSGVVFISMFMMLIVLVVVGHLTEEHGGQEHEDKGLKEGHKQFKEADGDCGDD